ncbi:hypothetical protein ACWD4V_18225 [Streptomyces tsukubensis]
MGPGTSPRPLRRIWTVTTSPAPGGPVLRCAACGPLPRPDRTPLRRAVLDHLALHARHAAVPPHLRTCQCREDGCHWHPRHRGCDGALMLLLNRDARGHTWRLADTCDACAAVTPHSAAVFEDRWTVLPPGHTTEASPGHGENGPAGHCLWELDEQHTLF